MHEDVEGLVGQASGLLAHKVTKATRKVAALKLLSMQLVPRCEERDALVSEHGGGSVENEK